MANKGGEGIGNFMSVLGNAFIPQTMDRFAAMDQGGRSRLAQGAMASEIMGTMGKTGRPDFYDYSKVAEGGAPMATPSTKPMLSVENQMGAAKAGAPEQFDAAIIQNTIAKLFSKPEEDYTLGPGDQRRRGKETIASNPVAPKPLEAQSAIAKAQQDLQNGLITKGQFDAIVTKETRAPGGDDAPAGYRWNTGRTALEPIPGGPAGKPKSIAEMFKEQFGGDVPSGYVPMTGADGVPTGDLRPAAGGPADIGQKGRPQAYKQQMAALDTLETTVKNLRDRFAETGTEMFNTEKAGDLDSLHTQFLLGVKNAEQLGALDKGAIDVADRLIKTPTGVGASFTANSYIRKQIGNYLDQLGRKRADLKKAFGASTAIAAGAVVDGYRFKGGDPNDQANWEQMQ